MARLYANRTLIGNVALVVFLAFLATLTFGITAPASGEAAPSVTVQDKDGNWQSESATVQTDSAKSQTSLTIRISPLTPSEFQSVWFTLRDGNNLLKTVYAVYTVYTTYQQVYAGVYGYQMVYNWVYAFNNVTLPHGYTLEVYRGGERVKTIALTVEAPPPETSGGGGAPAPATADVSGQVTDQLTKAKPGDTVSVSVTENKPAAVSEAVLDQVAQKGCALELKFTKTGVDSLVFDVQTVKAIAAQDGVAQISAARVAADSAAARFALASGGKVLAAYDISVSVGDKEVHSLAGKARVTLNLTGIDLTGVDPSRLAVLHKKADGTVEELAAVYSAGPPPALTFTTANLSVFAVVAKAPKVIKLTVGQPAAGIDGKPYTLDAAPYVKAKAGRTLVPVRFISEALGSKVEWKPSARQVVITDGREIVLTVGATDVFVDGRKAAVDCAPEIVAPGRTFVPLRFISETLGAEVSYNHTTKEITIVK
ncbi:MAG: copper amine oxidase N-terminal domain-containing protein [Bacillota bacterium]